MKNSSLLSINPPINIAGVPSSANWIKITKQYSDFSAGSLTNDIELFKLVPNGIIHSCVIVNSSTFTGGLVASSTLSVGISGNLVKYATASSVFGGTGLAGIFNNMGYESQTVSTSIRAAMITTIGNINTLTSGNAIFYLLISVLPN